MMLTNNQQVTMRAGVGKADITFRGQGAWGDLIDEQVKQHIPPEYLKMPVIVSDPLYARALVLDDGQQTVVFVTMDVTAIAARTISQNILSDIADDFMPKLRQRIEAELDLAGCNLNVSASHAHQVPRMLCDDNTQIQRVFEAVRDAMQNMVPVEIRMGVGHEASLTCNRTMMMKDGSDYTIRSYHTPLPPDEDVESLRPIDPEIGVLRVDRTDGQPLAVVYNFASHLLLGAPDGTRGTITADHVGVTQRHLEESIGDGVMAFFLQGALGDTAEVCQFDTEHPVNATEFGIRLGQSVLAAYRNTKPIPSNLRIISKQVELPLRTDIPDAIASLRQEQADLLTSLRYTSLSFKMFLPLYLKQTLSPQYPSHWAYRYMHAEQCDDPGLQLLDDRNRPAVNKYLQSIHTMEKLADLEERIATLEKHQAVIDELASETVSAEFQAIAIGDCLFISAPMEILAETGLKLKQKSPFQYTYIVSLANGYLHYAPPASYYPRGGYEVTECLLAPQWETIFEQVVWEFFDKMPSQNPIPHTRPSLTRSVY